MENECKTLIGCLKLVFYQKYFYDKMDYSLFYFQFDEIQIRKNYDSGYFSGSEFLHVVLQLSKNGHRHISCEYSGLLLSQQQWNYK